MAASVSESSNSQSDLDAFYAEYAGGTTSLFDPDIIRKSVADEATVKKFQTEGRPFHMRDPHYGDEILGYVMQDGSVLVTETRIKSNV